MEDKPIDRCGKCSNCGFDWDGGDILDELNKMDIYLRTPREKLANLAFQAYGYTAENKKHFSKVRIVTDIDHVDIQSSIIEGKLEAQIQNPLLYICTNCLHSFDSTTGKEFNSIREAKKYYYDLNHPKLSEDTQETTTI